MPRSFNLNLKGVRFRDPRVAARPWWALLLAANMAAALIAFHPWGGSAEDLQREQEAAPRATGARPSAKLANARALVAKVEQARNAGRQVPDRVPHGRGG